MENNTSNNERNHSSLSLSQFCLQELKCLQQAHLSEKKDTPKEKKNTASSLLSPREKQCVQGIIEKKTYKEIANKLGLSSRTIEFYCNNIRSKLSCKKKKDVAQHCIDNPRLLDKDH